VTKKEKNICTDLILSCSVRDVCSTGRKFQSDHSAGTSCSCMLCVCVCVGARLCLCASVCLSLGDFRFIQKFIIKIWSFDM
jgi:hypothetical protein